MRTITINLPADALAELQYVAPEEAPIGGDDWGDERDWPGIRVMLLLPAVEADSTGRSPGLRLDLRSGRALWGAPLHTDWGNWSPNRREYRYFPRMFRASTLADAEQLARAAVAEAAAVITEVVSARATRLARREATIAHAHAHHGAITADD